LLGKEDCALKLDFFPLRAEEVPLVDDYDVVVCNSLVRAKKTGEALHRYNQGPRTCKLICALIERQAQEDFGVEVRLERLGDLWYGNLCLTHEEVEDLALRAIPKALTPLAEAAGRLGLTPEAVRERWLGDLIEPDGGFPLRARMRHQITEFQRVEAFRDALQAGDVTDLGALLNASHESCARDYHVSCRELDCLVATARAAGAVGARLTGAGMGGCTVNLVPSEMRTVFCDRVDQGYYRQYLAMPPRAYPPDAIFVAQAAPGAGCLT
ncbi:MAG TPA: hypothetical protein ENN80_13500, partial [Candidatus Hydrogenedentes bacterium]|nr:hypothetical protein [Candidatus Hydrogenedentota bacterium]